MIRHQDIAQTYAIYMCGKFPCYESFWLVLYLLGEENPDKFIKNYKKGVNKK